ncbi:hypothetical protein [Kutzneria sp. NPDC052558]|uniref:hypothetical protein n=1 Tax=Kutzneria sp. NPDC052558 TaxID=3364121 RepID=UPI0037C72D9F
MVLINPGSGPLPTATEETAATNIERFNADVCHSWHYALVESRRRPDEDYGNGRYAWELAFARPDGDHHTCVSLDYADNSNSLVFPEPRLYVDNS